jgi:alkaline phosphatase D
MTFLSRRHFLSLAASFGASAALAVRAAPSRIAWRERRDLFPEGVASGDPDSASVLLWTRRPFADGRSSARLTVELAEDRAFRRVVARSACAVSPESDWTARVLVGKLKAASEYWYRFTDEEGNGSRIGRTLTAPGEDDPRTVRFAFVSCQNVNYGEQHAFRRMIHEDEAAPPEQRLGFVLHLGDFIYELVWYPEDRPQGMYGRRIRDILRYPEGEKIADFHIPTTVGGYRLVHATYLHDPDIQDARARWPFVTMWDNHEFSWLGWQGIQRFKGENRPAQTRKVAANQAWFEYHPARVRQPSGGHDRFRPPAVENVPVTRFDEHGLGQEPNNLAAIGSLAGYRALRWGRHVELIVTDQHSYRSEDPTDLAEAKAFQSDDFPEMMPEEIQRQLDAGRAWQGGRPPAMLRFGAVERPNFRADSPPQTVLGAEQKAWFLDRLKRSRATWKVWGNTAGTLDMRADPQNLPPTLGQPWPAGYAGWGGGDPSTAYVERAEIYDFVAAEKISGFATIAGDRHSFWAGLAAKALPPERFEPVGIAFITGSISAPGMAEAHEARFPKDHPLRPLYLAERGGGIEPTVNLTLRHGVRTALDYAAHGDLDRALALSNPDNAPHLSFVDMGGHGYAVVEAGAERFAVEFVCIPRPREKVAGPEGGPLRYRVRHAAGLWRPGETPALERRVIEGDIGLSA